MELINTLFNLIGEYGPLISLILSFFLLRNKQTLQITYLIGFFINVIINYILKGLFKEPRPTDKLYTFKLEKLYKNEPGFERYGMPSGHAQSIFYSTIFIYYVFRDVNITLFYVILSLFTLFQRVQMKFHTLAQVIVGSILGCFIGYLFFQYGEKQIKGVLTSKKDDNVGNFIILPKNKN